MSEADLVTTFRTQKGTFELDDETLADPWAVSREFARIHRYIDNLRPPYGVTTLHTWRRITGQRVKGGVLYTWRLIRLIDITGYERGPARSF